MNTQLPIEFDKSPQEIISMEGALDALLLKVDETINGFKPDLSTVKGRKEIASFAQKIARTKTAVDAAGKEMTDEWRRKTGEVNDVRKRARDELDKRKEEVRKPLTDWEEEQARLAEEKAKLEAKRNAELQRLVDMSCVSFGETSAQIKERIAKVEAFDLSDWWGDMLEKAHNEWKRSLESLNNQCLQAEQNEKQAAELAEMKRKEAEEARKRQEAEAKAKAEEEARQRAEREKQEAEEQRKLEAQRAKEAEEQRKRDLVEAEERARKAEQERIEAEKRREAFLESKRRADDEHHDKVVSEAVKALVDKTGLTSVKAAEIVTLIEKGQVPHVSISF